MYSMLCWLACCLCLGGVRETNGQFITPVITVVDSLVWHGVVRMLCPHTLQTLLNLHILFSSVQTSHWLYTIEASVFFRLFCRGQCVCLRLEPLLMFISCQINIFKILLEEYFSGRLTSNSLNKFSKAWGVSLFWSRSWNCLFLGDEKSFVSWQWL